MQFGCRECALGPCYIEKDYLLSCIDENDNVKKNIQPPEIVSKDFNTMPVECIPYYLYLVDMRIKKEYYKHVYTDWGIE